MAYFRCGGGGKTSLVLPTNPDLKISAEDKKITVSWTTPTTEVAIDHYNVYYSLTVPSVLEDMIKAGETYTNSFVLNNLTNDQKYYIAVESVDADGYENASVWKVEYGIPLELTLFFIGNDASNAKYSKDSGSTMLDFTIDSSVTYISGVAFNGETYVLTTGKKIYSSEDGINWVERLDSSSITYGTYMQVIYVPETNKFISLMSYSYSSNYYTYISYSSDGKNWSTPSNINSYMPISICYCNGKYYLFLNDMSSNLMIIHSSTNLSSWSQVTTISSVYERARGNEMCYVDKTNSLIYFIVNVKGSGTTYIYKLDTNASISSTNPKNMITMYIQANSMTYGKGVFVISNNYYGLNSAQTVRYSTDNLATEKSTKQTFYDPYVTFMNGKFYLMEKASSGTVINVYTSDDAVTWTLLNTYNVSSTLSSGSRLVMYSSK